MTGAPVRAWSVAAGRRPDDQQNTNHVVFPLVVTGIERGDMPTQDPTDPPVRSRTRRQLLSTAGAVVATAGLAGCGGTVTNYEFSATPVVLPPEAGEVPEYELLDSQSLTKKRSRTIGGVTVTATVESQLAVYGDDRIGDATAARPNLGVVSTPEASVAGRSFNPLAGRSLPNLLTSEIGTSLLQRVGLDRLGHPRDRIRWERGPTFQADRNGICLGSDTTLESYAGIVGSDPATVAFVHLTRVEADSVVIVAGVHGHDVDDPTRSFVGPDNSYLSPQQFAEAGEVYRDATAALRYQE